MTQAHHTGLFTLLLFTDVQIQKTIVAEKSGATAAA